MFVLVDAEDLIPQAAASTFASSNLLAVRLLLENSGVCSLQVWNHVIFIILHFLRAEQVISWRYSDSVLHGFLLTSTILGLSTTIEKPIHCLCHCLCLSVSVLMLAAWARYIFSYKTHDKIHILDYSKENWLRGFVGFEGRSRYSRIQYILYNYSIKYRHYKSIQKSYKGMVWQGTGTSVWMVSSILFLEMAATLQYEHSQQPPSNFSRAFSFANFTFTWQRNRTQAHSDIEVQHGTTWPVGHFVTEWPMVFSGHSNLTAACHKQPKQPIATTRYPCHHMTTQKT